MTRSQQPAVPESSASEPADLGRPGSDPAAAPVAARAERALGAGPRLASQPGVRGGGLLRAVAVMDALRAPDGDAWTHQQTHASLARYLLEETHEVLEVIDDPAAHGPGALADELGDLLFQILFHARVGQEEDPPWDIDHVALAFVTKMERRNPHVFGARREQALQDPADVEQIIAQWHAVKAAENAEHGLGRKGWFDGIPAELPALQTAAKVVHRARSEGRLEELLAAADAAASAEDAGRWGGELARALLDLVAVAESRDDDPETALRALLTRTRTFVTAAGESSPSATEGTRVHDPEGTA